MARVGTNLYPNRIQLGLHTGLLTPQSSEKVDEKGNGDLPRDVESEANFAEENKSDPSAQAASFPGSNSIRINRVMKMRKKE